jgi:hypothetical protein
MAKAANFAAIHGIDAGESSKQPVVLDADEGMGSESSGSECSDVSASDNSDDSNSEKFE